MATLYSALQFEHSTNQAFEELEKQLRRYVQIISPRPQETELRKWIIRKVRKEIYSAFSIKDLRTSVFGSMYTGVYLPSGDIDIMIFHNYLDSSTILDTLCSHLKSLKNSFVDQSSLHLVLHARVPVLKFNTKLGDVKVDITSNNDDGINSSRIVFQWTKQYILFHPLCLVLKEWLLSKQFAEVFTGGLGGYSLANMIVSLFQIYPQILDREDSLARFFLHFFEVYGLHFNYEHHAISVMNKKYIKKPLEVTRVGYQRANFGSSYGGGDNGMRLYIVDPATSTNNISKGTFRMGQIKEEFTDTFIRIEEALKDFKINAKVDLLEGIVQVNQNIEIWRDENCLQWSCFVDGENAKKHFSYSNSLVTSLYDSDDSSGSTGSDSFSEDEKVRNSHDKPERDSISNRADQNRKRRYTHG